MYQNPHMQAIRNRVRHHIISENFPILTEKSITLKVYSKIFPSIIDYLQKELKDVETILDLGCGNNSKLRHCKVTYSVGVDLFKFYLIESKQHGIHNDYILADLRRLNFRQKCVDAVMTIDVIEHLDKYNALDLIKRMENWARKKIIILVPNGFTTQDIYDGNPLQTRKSGWNADEMASLGFMVRGINGSWFLRGEMAELKYEPKTFSKIISDCSQKVIYRMPRYAYHLLCVRDL